MADTEKCLLNNDPETCEFRTEELEQAEAKVGEDLAPPVLAPPEERPTLWVSRALGVDDVQEIMSQRNCLLVGLVGAPDAGKTAAIVSLYLLLAHGKLDGFQYADSRSLLALEEISQGARQWGEVLPEELTVRTEIGDGRVAGFLHLRVKHKADKYLVDFLIPDLPGEWTDALIDNNRADRLDFLKSAHVIWLMVNGEDLRNEQRMYTLSRTRRLVRRLSEMMGPELPTVKLVISHADAGELPEDTLTQLQTIFDDLGVAGEILPIASFSKIRGIRAGAGIAKLVAASLPTEPAAPAFWPAQEVTSGRFMLRYVSPEGAP